MILALSGAHPRSRLASPRLDERLLNPYVARLKSMLTRAFLLLLAMMTGLSAAQAADGQRPAQGLALAAAASALAASSKSSDEEVQGAAHIGFVRPDHRLVLAFPAAQTDVGPHVPAIRLSDRFRA